MAEKEYIEREKLRQAFLTDLQSLSSWDVSLFKLLMIEIDEVPSADVAPVRHGRFRSLTFSGDTIICSECKIAYNIFETNGAENFNFCPHCGAKMDLKEV